MRAFPSALLSLLSCAAIVKALKEPCKDCEFTTVVDILSESAMFSTFLRVLQRHGDIPTLNELQNYTLLAPINTAFAGIVEPENDSNFDINNYILRDTVLQSSDIENGTSVIYQDVKFPINLRRDEGGNLRINEATIVEPDLTPNFQNATVHGISGLLPNPSDSRSLIHTIASESRDAGIFDSFVQGYAGFNHMTQNNTLLIPLDVNFFKSFNHIEINYIVDNFSELPSLDGSSATTWSHDRQLFLQNLICEGIIGGHTADEKTVNNLNNRPVQFESHELGSSISVNDSAVSSKANLVFDRGIAHSFSELPFLPDAFQFNAEKYLHGMNSTDFVKELHFRKLQSMIQERSLQDNLTIFVPEVAASDEHQGFTKSSLLYHFVEDQIWLEEEFKEVNRVHSLTKMFPSAFCSSNKRLGGNCQRLRVTKAESSYIINDKFRILHAKPYLVGRTLIYTISEDIQLPGEFLPSLNPFYHCSRSLSFLRQANLLDLPVNNKGYTILLPCFDSWKDYELNFEYIKHNQTAVELITKSLILQTLIYSDIESQTTEVENMLGEKVSISIGPSEEAPNRIDLELSNMASTIKIEKGFDSLFNQGVVHPLKEAHFPKEISITLKDLIKTTGADNFLQLLEAAEDLTHIINEDEQFSILVPTSSSLELDGITVNSTNLHDFLKLHIINGSSTQDLLNCKGQVGTLEGERLLCRESSPGSYWLRLENGADHEVRILRKGCSSSVNETCVFLIDRPFSLLWLRRDKNPLKLPGVAMGAGVLVGSVSMLAVFLCILLVLFGKSVKKPILPVSPDEEHASQETRPLLANGPSRAPTRAPPPSSSRQRGQRFESTYSSNASVPAIDVANSPR